MSTRSFFHRRRLVPARRRRQQQALVRKREQERNKRILVAWRARGSVRWIVIDDRRVERASCVKFSGLWHRVKSGRVTYVPHLTFESEKRARAHVVNMRHFLAEYRFKRAVEGLERAKRDLAAAKRELARVKKL